MQEEKVTNKITNTFTNTLEKTIIFIKELQKQLNYNIANDNSFASNKIKNDLKISLSRFIDQYNKLIKINTREKEEYINQITQVNSILDTTNNDDINNYITIKLEEQPVFIKEQIPVSDVTEIITNIIDKLKDDINIISKNIKNTDNEHRKYFSEQMVLIDTKLNEYNNQYKEINLMITNLEQLNTKYDEYNNTIFYDDNETHNLQFIAPECIEFEMITYTKINEKTPDLDLEILNNDAKTNSDELLSLNKILQNGSGIFNQNDNIQNDNIVDHINNYYDKMVKLSTFINSFKNIINKFKKVAMEYNIRYIHFSNHLLFITTYLRLINMNNEIEYKIYNYLSKGSLTYYMRIIDKIALDIKNKNKNSLGIYFYKNHYINIQILKNFLSFLFQNWDKYQDKCPSSNNTLVSNYNITDEKKNILSKLYLYNDNYNSQIKKGIFIFNAFKDILDQYYLNFAPPVGIYLRINDWNINKQNNLNSIIFDKDATQLGQINRKSLNKCLDNGGKPKNTAKELDKAASVKFQEVFDPTGFDDNEILAKYMSIPSFLQNGTSIMLITYGYSGVGKTFTVFGTKTPPTSGVLQTSLNSIQQKGKIYYRAYEIYGLAIPYNIYWDRTVEDYNHFIYNYTDINNITKIKSKNTENTVNPMTTFLEEIKNINEIANITEKSTFKHLEEHNITDFSEIITKIDEKRKINGTIKRTINNIVSSRSIMIYDFVIERINNTPVFFVIIDLPGKENIMETFVKDVPVDELDCIPLNIDNLKNNNLDFKKNNSAKSTEISNTIELIKAMAFISPMSLMLCDTYANKLIELYNKSNNFDKKYDDLNLTFKGKMHYKINKDANYIDALNKLSSNIKIYGLEIMRNIIINNRFDILQELYDFIFNKNDNIHDKKITEKCAQHDSNSMTPFEGYYINENINGLITTILRHLGCNTAFIKEQTKIYSNNNDKLQDLYDKNVSSKSDSSNSKFDIPNNDELINQTYFFRVLASTSTYVNNTNQTIVKGSGDEPNYERFDILKHYDYKYLGHSIKYWLSDTNIYDYNKVYRLKSPPIKIILSSYFEKIKKYYIFYVVSNQNKDKCEKQIKFIADSNDFLTSLATYTYKPSKN